MPVDSSRLEQLLARLQAKQEPRSASLVMRICMICADVLPVNGAGVTLISAEEHNQLASTDEIARGVEDLQATLGEGPCVDVMKTRVPVMEPDLASTEAREHWPTFSPPALQLGARAVFGFPLVLKHEPVGSLDLYARGAGSLTDDEISVALMLADMAALAVEHSRSTTDRVDAETLSEPEEPWAHPAVVHHASGMTAVQLGISVDEALVRLRAFAFASDRDLREVAAEVAARRLRLDAWGRDDV